MNTKTKILIGSIATLCFGVFLYLTNSTEYVGSEILVTAKREEGSAATEYIATLEYPVPNGDNEGLTVTTLVEGDTIITFTVGHVSTNPKSERYHGLFDEDLAEMELVGKKIGDISASRLGGASVTTKNFMRAVEAIEVEMVGQEITDEV